MQPENSSLYISLSTSQVDSTELSRGVFGREEPEGGKRSSVILYVVPISASRFGRVWYFVDLDREERNARRSAVSNARHRTHDQHRCNIGTRGGPADTETPSAAGTASMSVANVSPLAGVLTIFLVAATPAWAADNLSIERLATCQDSWLDWKESDPVQLKKFANSFQSDFLRKEKDPFFVPKSNHCCWTSCCAGVPREYWYGRGFLGCGQRRF